MKKTATAILTSVAAAALATAGCSKPAEDGYTSAEATGHETSGEELEGHEHLTEHDDMHGQSGTAEIGDSEEEGPASPAY